jgi:hypothetical protein
MACNEAIDFMAKHPGTLTAWVSPTYRQSKIAYRLIRRALHKILTYKSDAELRLELPNGATIMFCSADNYDALRGNGIHFLIIDECADVNEKAWLEVLRPCLSDTNGKALFIGTPKGRNFFYTLFTRGLDPLYPDWESFTAPSAANPYIKSAEIETAKRELPEDTFAQEYEAVFLEESAGVFRRIDACINGEYVEQTYIPGHTYVLGWDVAKYQDYSVISVLDISAGNSLAYWWRGNTMDYTVQLAQVERIARAYSAYILMDMTGVGDPLLEQLLLKGLPAEGYLFNNASKKALIEKLALAFQHGNLKLPDIPVLTAELRQFEYKLSPSRLVTYGAPNGAHDDCVISLGLAYFAAALPHGPLMWSADATQEELISLERAKDEQARPVMEIERFEETGEWYEMEIA